jgi:hypothetical protein
MASSHEKLDDQTAKIEQAPLWWCFSSALTRGHDEMGVFGGSSRAFS